MENKTEQNNLTFTKTNQHELAFKITTKELDKLKGDGGIVNDFYEHRFDLGKDGNFIIFLWDPWDDTVFLKIQKLLCENVIITFEMVKKSSIPPFNRLFEGYTDDNHWAVDPPKETDKNSQTEEKLLFPGESLAKTIPCETIDSEGNAARFDLLYSNIPEKPVLKHLFNDTKQEIDKEHSKKRNFPSNNTNNDNLKKLKGFTQNPESKQKLKIKNLIKKEDDNIFREHFMNLALVLSFLPLIIFITWLNFQILSLLSNFIINILFSFEDWVFLISVRIAEFILNLFTGLILQLTVLLVPLLVDFFSGFLYFLSVTASHVNTLLILITSIMMGIIFPMFCIFSYKLKSFLLNYFDRRFE
jgi:hypothetical protein